MNQRLRGFLAVSLAVPALFALSSCSSRHKLPPVGVDSHPIAFTPRPHPVDAADGALAGHLVANVPMHSVGPFLARRDDALVAVYAMTGESGTRWIVTVPLDASGKLRGNSIAAANPISDVTALIVRATRGERPGFVVAWTALTDRGEAVFALGLDDDGRPRGEAIEIGRTQDDVVWLDVVATPRGAVCVWAEETRNAGANILAVALDSTGKSRGVPSRVVKGASGWQALAVREGVGLAILTPAATASPEKHAASPPSKGGRVSAVVKDPSRQEPPASRGASLGWLVLDSDARAIGTLSPVAPRAAVGADFDVVAVGDRLLFAWTDRSGIDPAVQMVWFDAKAPSTAERAFPLAGRSSMLALVGGEHRALMVWDDAPTRAPRLFHASALSPPGEAGVGATPEVTLEGDGSVPEVAALGDGYAVSMRGRTCASPDPTRCVEAGAMPLLVRLDAALVPVQTEPLWLPGKRTPAHGWGLSCGHGDCLVLAATADSPAPVHALHLVVRGSPRAAPLPAPSLPDAPVMRQLSTVASGETFADVGAVRFDTSALVATLTTAIEEGRERAAVLSTRMVDARGGAEGPPNVLSKRALNVGGLSIAKGGTPEQGAAVAWVARENGDLQVHVTRVDRRGRRMNDVQLTTAKGDAGDVAIAWAGDGWIVAWVDGRDGNGEVYATKVAPDLHRVAREERITQAPGDASGVVLSVDAGRAYVAWSDPRESPEDGFADIFLAVLDPKTAKKRGDEVRVLPTAAHSRSPSLATLASSVIVGWIEEPPAGASSANSRNYGAMLARFDADGRPLGEPWRLDPPGDGFAGEVALERAGESVRIVEARADHEELFIDAGILTGEAAVGARQGVAMYPLRRLQGPASLDVSLALVGGDLFFNDDGAGPADRQVKRGTIDWKH